MTNEERARLWDKVNRYVVACGGDPSKHVYGNTARQSAVAGVERAFRDVEARWASAVREVTDAADAAVQERDAARREVDQLKVHMERSWSECHDGSEQACCKSHE